MITLKDIAAEAGVSTMTVSNILNGKNEKVSKPTLDKVNKIIKKLNYVPNSAARMLSAKSSKIVALCLSNTFLTPNIRTNAFESPYDSQLIGLIQQTVEENGYYVMLCGGKTPEDILGNLKTWNVDGAIFLPGFDSIISKLVNELNIPMVFLDSYYSKTPIMNIGIDDYQNSMLATRYLINCGHQQIAFASNLTDTNTLLQMRFKGYRDALELNGIAFTPNLNLAAHISYEGGVEIGKEIVRRGKITAVFSTADVMAIGIMEGARLSGMSLPKDLSVIGFDDLPISSYITPKLTTIHQDIKQKASLTTSKLFELIGDCNTPKEKYTLPVTLMERQSVISLR